MSHQRARDNRDMIIILFTRVGETEVRAFNKIENKPDQNEASLVVVLGSSEVHKLWLRVSLELISPEVVNRV